MQFLNFFQEIAVKDSSAVLLLFLTLTIMMAVEPWNSASTKAPNVVPVT